MKPVISNIIWGCKKKMEHFIEENCPLIDWKATVSDAESALKHSFPAYETVFEQAALQQLIENYSTTYAEAEVEMQYNPAYLGGMIITAGTAFIARSSSILCAKSANAACRR
ncbi:MULTISPECIES: hypothetical protein [Neisseria]|uniref:Uncharacterized protein n=1 Tax=Neisseria musculi TaxID=1815583 RepID=A0A7H1MDW1_9NEIS|nr:MULTISPECIES: hypothetical protein [Neisseria]MBF0802951.1 hypothetical protein [Neisseria sp. 19428wB4_WF04]QNT59826.1 hypothetical protein H7A79_0646 [Neisseria musculi]TFU44480.1 hypothetical protein E4T99_00965 [Neisseria sp. WF04]